jgi:hypothetical protein
MAKVNQAGSMTQQQTEATTANDDTEFVLVRRQWNDRRVAKFRVEDIGDLHWSRLSGGVRSRAPREFLHGYVLCCDMLDGELSHSCRHGRGPHSIKVCVVKKDNAASVFTRLSQLAKGKNDGSGERV